MKLSVKVMLILVMLHLIGCAPKAITAEELIGTWEADYSKYNLIDTSIPAAMTFTERIVLKLDHTYEQFRDDELIAKGDWRYNVQTHSVYLTGAIMLEEGKSMEPRFGGVAIGCDGRSIKFDGTEVILCVKRKSGSVILHHLPIGDPDSPVFITFEKVSSD